jgi:CDP-diacylglycerol pyrophosphatase
MTRPAMMTRRRRVWLSAMVVVVVIAAAAAVVIVRHTGSRPKTDCQVMREMIAYNKSQGKAFAAAFDPDQEREPTVADYRKWAD